MTLKADGIALLPVHTVIAGVHKCATTSLWTALQQHPSIVSHDSGQLFGNYPEALKTGRELDCLAGLRRNYQHGDSVLVRDTTLYDDLDKLKSLIDLYPDLRVIVCVREPASRAFSAFMHARNRGFEQDYDSFEKALADFREGSFPKRNPPLLDYFRQGFYWERVRAISSILPLSRILLVCSEDLKTRHDAVYQEVFSFLGLPGHSVVQVHANARSDMRFKSVGRYLRGDSLPKQLVRKLVSPGARSRLMRLLMQANRTSDKASSIPRDCETTLTELYADDWAATRKFMDKKLWRTELAHCQSDTLFADKMPGRLGSGRPVS